MRTCLITGIQGAGGSYLADYILDEHPEVDVHGIARWRSRSFVNPKYKSHECDLLDLSSIIRVIELVKPDVIFHLAAHANVRASFDIPLAVMENNIMGTANLLEAVRLTTPKVIFHMCSTSEVYGQITKEECPIKEDGRLAPASPYAISKLTQDLLSGVYYQAYNIPVIRTRMFTYINPRRSDLFATNFAMQIAKVEAGLLDKVRHGNLDSVRSILDVRDAVASYWHAAKYCEPGEVYNIGGDTGIRVGDVLEKLTSMSPKKIELCEDPALLRPIDISYQIPDSTKFRNKTGWTQRYNIDESLQWLLEECRKII